MLDKTFRQTKYRYCISWRKILFYVAGKTGLVKLSIISTNGIMSLVLFLPQINSFICYIPHYKATRPRYWLVGSSSIYYCLSRSLRGWYSTPWNIIQKLKLSISIQVLTGNVCVTDFQPIKDSCRISQITLFYILGSSAQAILQISAKNIIR